MMPIVKYLVISPMSHTALSQKLWKYFEVKVFLFRKKENEPWKVQFLYVRFLESRFRTYKNQIFVWGTSGTIVTLFHFIQYWIHKVKRWN